MFKKNLKEHFGSDEGVAIKDNVKMYMDDLDDEVDLKYDFGMTYKNIGEIDYDMEYEDQKASMPKNPSLNHLITLFIEQDLYFKNFKLTKIDIDNDNHIFTAYFSVSEELEGGDIFDPDNLLKIEEDKIIEVFAKSNFNFQVGEKQSAYMGLAAGNELRNIKLEAGISEMKNMFSMKIELIDNSDMDNSDSKKTTTINFDGNVLDYIKNMSPKDQEKLARDTLSKLYKIDESNITIDGVQVGSLIIDFTIDSKYNEKIKEVHDKDEEEVHKSLEELIVEIVNDHNENNEFTTDDIKIENLTIKEKEDENNLWLIILIVVLTLLLGIGIGIGTFIYLK